MKAYQDIFRLRESGRIEEAYELARVLYATQKDSDTTRAMFWAAADVLEKRLTNGYTDENNKIFLALKRLLPNVPDNDGQVEAAFRHCENLLIRRKEQSQVTPAHHTHLDMGAWGEELAAAYLRKKEYIILECDWHSGHRDIDIIAQHHETIVFVEVKTRCNADLVEPESAVNYTKQHHLQQSINHYIKLHHLSNPVRFDVITIVGTPEDSDPVINHIEDFTLYTPFTKRSFRRRY